MSERIGLFGGTFDPVHKGHQSIADAFLKSGLIDSLWVLLTPYPPHKQEETQASYEDRHHMLKTAFRGKSNIEINTIEHTLPKPSYSVQTIRHLKEKYPDKHFYFCMGEDSLKHFDQWKYYEEILDECELLVARRPGVSHNEVEKKILEKTHFVDHEPLDVSSSDIKQKIKEGQSADNELDEEVLSFIEKEQLYY